MNSAEAIKHLDKIHYEALPHHLKVAANSLDWPKLHDHLVASIIKEVSENPELGKGFYNHSMTPVYEHNHETRGFSHGDHTVFNALLGLTSAALNPVQNLVTADKMLKEGERRGGSFDKIPLLNEPDFNTWIESLSKAPPTGKDGSIKAAIRLAEKHKALQLSSSREDGIPFKARQVKVVDQPGHPHHGKIVSYVKGDQWIKHRDTDATKLKGKWIPDLNEEGQITPKGWSVRGPSIRSGLATLQRILHHFGGSTDLAGDWLNGAHTVEEHLKVAGKKPAQAYFAEGEKIPGSFTFGPKFGAFIQNLNGNLDHLTSDMWHARTMNRYIGKAGFKDGSSGPRESSKDLIHWHRAMKEAAEKLGMKIADVQSNLWSREQALHKSLGVKVKAKTYADGVDAVTDGGKIPE